MSRLRMSLLGEDGGTDVDLDTATEPGVDNLESSLLEVNESTEEGDAVEGAIEDGAEIHEALGDLQEELQVAQENGGLDKQAARIASLHLQHLLARAGHKNPSRVLPSMESFGTTGSRQQATRLGLEAIGQTMKDLWKRIVEMVRKAYDWCYKHYQQLLGASKKLKERAEKLSQRASAIDSGDKFDNAGIDNEGLSKRLSLNGAVSPTAGIAVLKEAVETYVSKWEETSKGASKALLDAMEKVTEAVASADEGKLKALEGAVAEVGKAAGGIKSISGAKDEKGDGADRKVANLPGGKSIVISAVPSGAMTKAEAKKVKIAIEETKGFKPVKAFSPLKADVVGKMCDEVAAVADLMEDFSKIQPAIKRYEAGVVKAGEALSKATVTDQSGKTSAEHRNLVQTVGTLAIQVAPAFGTFPVKVLNTAIAGLKAHLDYAELSLARYSKDTTGE